MILLKREEKKKREEKDLTQRAQRGEGTEVTETAWRGAEFGGVDTKGGALRASG